MCARNRQGFGGDSRDSAADWTVRANYARPRRAHTLFSPKSRKFTERRWQMDARWRPRPTGSRAQTNWFKSNRFESNLTESIAADGYQRMATLFAVLFCFLIFLYSAKHVLSLPGSVFCVAAHFFYFYTRQPTLRRTDHTLISPTWL